MPRIRFCQAALWNWPFFFLCLFLLFSSFTFLIGSGHGLKRALSMQPWLSSGHWYEHTLLFHARVMVRAPPVEPPVCYALPSPPPLNSPLFCLGGGGRINACVSGLKTTSYSVIHVSPCFKTYKKDSKIEHFWFVYIEWLDVMIQVTVSCGITCIYVCL